MKYKCVLWFLLVSCLSVAWTVSAAQISSYEAVWSDSSVCEGSDDDSLLCTHVWPVYQTGQPFVSDEIFDLFIFPNVSFAVIRGPPGLIEIFKK